MAVGPNVVVVHPAAPVQSLRELQDFARAARPPLSYASPGVGSTGMPPG